MTASARELQICLPIADRRSALDFYTRAFALEPVGTPAEDGIPEPLQFRLGTRTLLMLIPTGGFSWVIGDRPVAPPGTSECLMSMTLDSEVDVDRVASRVADAGGGVLSPPGRRDWGYAAVCVDPDGHAWQLIAEPAIEG